MPNLLVLSQSRRVLWVADNELQHLRIESMLSQTRPDDIDEEVGRPGYLFGALEDKGVSGEESG